MKKKEKKLVKYNLACGQIKMDGYIGVDIAKTKEADIVADLTKPWKFAEDSSCDEVFCSHFFEHLTGAQRIDFMHELYRILIVGGKATIITPYWANTRAIQDPTHQWPPVCEASYLYFNKQWREQNKLDHYNIHCDFDFSYGYAVDPLWATRSQESRDFAVRHYNHVVNDLQVMLVKK